MTDANEKYGNEFIERITRYHREWETLEDMGLPEEDVENLMDTGRGEVFEIIQPKQRVVMLAACYPPGSLRIRMEYPDDSRFPNYTALERLENGDRWVPVALDGDQKFYLRWYLDIIDLSELLDGPPVGFSDSRDLPPTPDWRAAFLDMPDASFPQGFLQIVGRGMRTA